MRRHISYANVVATLALVFAMSGGALAANHYLIESSTQIKPSVLKKLRGPKGLKGLTGTAGTPGAPGATGKEGPQGKEGTQGKEGKTGKEGPEGQAGSALGYASITAAGTFEAAHSKGVVSVTRPSPGVYCFDLSFTPNVATADAKHIGGNYKLFTETSAGPADVEAFTPVCTAPHNDATVITLNGTEIVEDGFYVSFD
jgi:hypothetical protein